jgi:hypothetical protein
MGSRLPIEVRLPSAQGSDAASDASGSRWENKRVIGVVAMVAAGVLVVVFGLWFVAYQLGQREQRARQRDQMNTYLDTVAPAPTTVIPSMPGPTPGVSVVPDGTSDIANQPGAPAADPRKSGNNYLHIVTLSWKDAERAVGYLEKNGVPAAAVAAGAAKTVDPSEARAKNLPHLVFALEAIPSDQYRATERKRQELVDRVKRIGKKWQSEEKGPSDFGEPGWAKFK